MTKNPYNGHDREIEGRAWDDGYKAGSIDTHAVRDELQDEAIKAAYRRGVDEGIAIANSDWP